MTVFSLTDIFLQYFRDPSSIHQNLATLKAPAFAVTEMKGKHGNTALLEFLIHEN